MELRDFFSEDAIKLELEGTTKDEILKELIGLLGLDDKSEGMLFKMLKRRENLGSTGIGRGIAIPHCRSLVVSKLRVAFGRKSQGVDFKAIDEKPVFFFFLIVAPPLEVSNQYLPVLGKIAQFSKGVRRAGAAAQAQTARRIHGAPRGEVSNCRSARHLGRRVEHGCSGFNGGCFGSVSGSRDQWSLLRVFLGAPARAAGLLATK